MTSNRHITGFTIKEALFENSLSIPLTEDGVDTQFYLHSADEPREAAFRGFRLFAFVGEAWVSICSGSILVDFKQSASTLDHHEDYPESNEMFKSLFDWRSKSSSATIDPSRMYQMLRTNGFGFGPSFRSLTALECKKEMEVVGKLFPFDEEYFSWSENVQSHVIHPTTLDGVFQMALAAVSKCGVKAIPTMVPTKIHRLWISNTVLAKGEALDLYGKAEPSGRNHDSFVVGTNRKEDSTHIVVEGLEVTPVADDDYSVHSQATDTQLCYYLDFKPDLDLLDHHQTLEYCRGNEMSESEPVEFFQDLQLVMLHFMADALNVLDLRSLHGMKPHFQRYISWMRLKMDQLSAMALPNALPKWSALLRNKENQAAVVDKVENSNAQGKFYVEVGRNIVNILEEKVDPLALLFQGDLAKDFYRDLGNNLALKRALIRYLDVLGHKDPGMRILEIGAGTGAMTSIVVDTLGHVGSNGTGCFRYAQYDYTDISPSFFPAAQSNFLDQGHRMQYKVLDIELDPTSQGFEEGGYSLVVAASVSYWFLILTTY